MVEVGNTALLPFRVKPINLRGQQVLVLEYESEVLLPNGTLRKMPFTLDVGTADRDARLVSNWVGRRVLDLLEMYWELEKRQAGSAAQMDDLQSQLAMRDGQIKKLEAQVDGYRRQSKQKFPAKKDEKTEPEVVEAAKDG